MLAITFVLVKISDRISHKLSALETGLTGRCEDAIDPEEK